MRSPELDRHPYLASSPCERCAASSGLVDHSENCPACGGSKEVFDLRATDIDPNMSIRIGDLLIQKFRDHRLRGRFDHWPPHDWQYIHCDAGLGSMLRNVRDRGSSR